ncbi:acyl-CoA thioesterase [Arsenicicoccus piscis]|uniref:Acyl-CoA thioesterase n=1 Tax=Arsenicicoccus piscis TaxID=673954 RepID=A0ABQ6HQE3_9MICO|nr:acyl-CoA thioesterase [Arsenicicoccus piscis]MCH8628086.1 acyl-CoA thioesterase [Arsenicicoccus piscis]GMA20551.1 acyl-CoA thioesterase [Arsenicicoccus piscis]
MPGTQRSVTLRFMAAPTDGNVRGRVGGGKMLEWIDKAGYACAAGWSGTYCVTAYVGNIHFTRPVEVGDIVEVEARVVHTGRTSMHVVCTVSSGDPRDGELTPSTQCLLIFVSVGEDGRPIPVAPWSPQDDWERTEQERAIRLMGVRQDIEADMERQHYTDATESCRETLRFMAAPTDVNWGGKVHGGIVMRWIDEAASLVASRWHGGPSVAVYAGGVRFYRPLLIGHLVEVEARLIYTGHSSMHISVHVRSGDPKTGEMAATTHCTMVLVALDDDWHKVHVRSWNPRLEEDLALQEHAKKQIDIRESLRRPLPVARPHADGESPTSAPAESSTASRR